MRCRLLRRCLLFALLGLVTAVVVAWGVAVRRQIPPYSAEHLATGVAVVDDVLVRVSIWGGFGWRAVEWLLEDTTLDSESSELAAETAARVLEIGPEAFEREESELLGGQIEVPDRRVDRLAARGPPVGNISSGGTSFVREASGLPLPALGMTVRGDYFEPPPSAPAGVPAFSFTESACQVVEIPVTLGSGGRSGPIRLPVQPRPGLLLNTIFYALLWALLLLAPGAVRRRIRRARGRCPACGYSLRGQPEPGCPECGSGRAAPAPAPQRLLRHGGLPGAVCSELGGVWWWRAPLN